ncbi:hypothetical protein [Nonomuraea sp. NPDC049646]|uniref:hypothetical protein n=1 Tax=unclassified Nonomuraea TaxID=2593643 RepID=UPI0037B0051D
MATTISDDRMTSDMSDTTATLIGPGRWTVSGRPGVYSRDQAVTAMAIAELRAHKLPGPNDSIMIDALEQELLVPVMPTDAWALLQTLKAAAAAVRRMATTGQLGDERDGTQVGTWLLRIGEAVNDLAPALEPLIEAATEHVTPEAPDDPWHYIKDEAARAKDVIDWGGEVLRRLGWTARHAEHNSRVTGGKHWGPIQLPDGRTAYGWTCDASRYPRLHAQLMAEQGLTTTAV